jgi:RNA polymerase sigma-70 factor (ECF subfamily)
MANASQINPRAGGGLAYLQGDAGVGASGAIAARLVGAFRVVRGRQISTDDASDEALVARVSHGDRHALQLLFGRHRQRVYRFALRLVGNNATAEDIVSEVFLELWRRAASFERRAQLSTWLLAITRNKALSALRVRVDQPLDEVMAETMADPAITPEESLHANERSALVRRCLERLSPAQREIIDLVYYHEKSVDEVAAIVGVPAATVKTRMFYARKRLAALVKDAGTMPRC